MTPEQAKLKQREDARRRSRQAPRRASSQAVSSDQSEVTEEAPAVYRVPQINVPEDLQGAAKLIQTELAKIEQSQSILLTLWEKLKSQSTTTDTDGSPALKLTETLIIDPVNDHSIIQWREDTAQWNYNEWRTKSDGLRDAYMGIAPDTNEFQMQAERGGVYIGALNDIKLQPNNSGSGGNVLINGSTAFNPIPNVLPQLEDDFNNAPWGYCMISGVTTNSPGNSQTYGTLLTLCSMGTNGWATPAEMIASGQMYWLQQIFVNTSAALFIRQSTNGQPWGAWLSYTANALTMEEIKKEIYAELLELNPGIVIPKTD